MMAQLENYDLLNEDQQYAMKENRFLKFYTGIANLIAADARLSGSIARNSWLADFIACSFWATVLHKAQVLFSPAHDDLELGSITRIIDSRRKYSQLPVPKQHES